MRWLSGASVRTEPSPANPVLYRWIATADHFSAMYADKSVRHLIRLILPRATIPALVADVVAYCAAEEARVPGARPVLMLQNYPELAPLGAIGGNAADAPSGVPWVPGSPLMSIFSAAGVADVLAKSRDFFGQLAAALAAAGLQQPRALHLDYEAVNYSWFYQSAGHPCYGADFIAGQRVGYYTPCLNDPRAATERIYGDMTLRDLDALRVREGYTYDDFSTAFSAANSRFNGVFLGSVPIVAERIAKSTRVAAREAFGGSIVVSNYDAVCADAPGLAVRDLANPEAFSYPFRAHALDAHAPVLYPMSWVNAPTLRAPYGGDKTSFQTDMALATVAAVQASSQGKRPIVPWFPEPTQGGTDGDGWVVDGAFLLSLWKTLWSAGIFEFVLWGFDYADPHAAEIYAAWSDFRAWVVGALA